MRAGSDGNWGLPSPVGRAHRARILRSFGFAWAGVRYTARSQPNWWVHLAIAVATLATGLVLRATPLELALLALTIGLVLAAEAANTAVEAAVDAIGGPPSSAARAAKDTSAAAVLISAVAAVVVGLLVLGPRLLERLR